MSIAIDGIVFSLQRHGGISVYFHELLRALARQGDAATLTLETPALQDIAAATPTLAVAPRRARALERYRRARVPAHAQVFHSSYYRRPAARDVPTVVTVHDFIYERFRHGPARWVHLLQKHAAIRAAQVVICISEATRQDLLHWVGETPGQTIHVVHNGVGDGFRPLGLPPRGVPFALYVGERRGYKNFRVAVQALARVPELELHCVGGGPLRPDELAEFDPALRARVRHLGFVEDQRLNECYNLAECLLYPSAYEGFGIPPLEAMKAGCPVVCVDCAAVREVGGDALTVAEAMTPDAVATAMLRIADTGHRDTVVRAGLAVASRHSWAATHARTLEIYRELQRR